MEQRYSIEVIVQADDADLVNIPSKINEAITRSVILIDGVTNVSVNQIVLGDLQEPTEP